jgi:hypothetical protein
LRNDHGKGMSRPLILLITNPQSCPHATGVKVTGRADFEQNIEATV